MEEIWKPFTYNGITYNLYEISSQGKVRPTGSKMYLTSNINKRGYVQITLYVLKNNQMKNVNFFSA